MGVPVPEMNPVEEATAEALLGSLRTISAPERRKHASVYNYWLSIRGDRKFPPIHDLDPLEIADAGAYSVLLEMIGGGEDADIRHLGNAIGAGIDAAQVSGAPSPSLLSCIATRLPVVAACRDAFAFEDEFETADGKTRCWVTLLPFSVTGTWIDFVYGFVSLDPSPGAVQATPETGADVEPAGDLAEVLRLADSLADADGEAEEIQAEEPESTAVVQSVEREEDAEMPYDEPAPAQRPAKPGFSAKFFEGLSKVGAFYGTPVETGADAFKAPPEQADEPSAEEPLAAEPEAAEAEEPVAAEAAPEEPVADEPVAPEADEPVAAEPETPESEEPVVAEPETAESEEPAAPEPAVEHTSMLEGTLQTRLTDVRAKADEARQAKLRANTALYEGLSAAYDFALEAEENPEEYLRLVQAEGLKIQLRSPMRPVAKLAFDGMCDEATIKQLEAILAWAFDEELPRGTLAERIEAEGGIGPILNGQAKAA